MKFIKFNRFFTLLCICHTVMAEEKKGILTYQAQSPDEGALVSAARNFGFVFKSRTPKTITVIIRGEEKTYDVLNILDFNNVRKRMSTICRIDNKIVLFCKGADTIIKERLSTECRELFELCEDHLNKFAEDALRTLCLAWRQISDEEYARWAEEYHAASTSLDNRAEKVSDVYEKIETNLEYIGATAIEDKLQDGVPECIAKLAKANIKIWVLTGDKLETAINIGYSCQLLTNDMEVFTIESNNELDIRKQLLEKRSIVEKAHKRLQLKQSYLNEKVADANSIEKGDYNGNGNGKSAIFMTNVNEPNMSGFSDFALVISGQSLVYALNPNCEKHFLDLACMCKAVICCRVTPGQKKAVVDLVKTHKKAITLAIGDGANDVSMIKCIQINQPLRF